MYEHTIFQQRAEAICACGRFLYARGWCPATSSNFSARLDAEHAALTASGRHKGELSAADILAVNWRGEPVDSTLRPSAETLLHTQLYQMDTAVGAVLHTHSAHATVLSRLFAAQGALYLEDYELLKALHGVHTHETAARVPIFPNTQDIAALAVEVAAYLDNYPDTHGYCIAGHGLYTWGRDIDDARRHVEAFEFLFDCEITRLQITGLPGDARA